MTRIIISVKQKKITLKIKNTFSHFFSEPVDFSFRRAENDGLSDRKSIVQIAQGVKFPLFSLDSDEKLFDSLQRQFITFYENSDRIGHEFMSHFQNFMRKSSGNQNNLKIFCDYQNQKSRECVFIRGIDPKAFP